MKFTAAVFVFLTALLAFSGCDSMPRVIGGPSREPPRAHVFSADRKASYEAARHALDRMQYRFVRGGPAQGELEAVSGLVAGNSLSNTHQILFAAKFVDAPEGTEVRVWLKEAAEANATKGLGRATETALRDTPLYEVFFRELQHALDAGKKG
jgi:hypothetical protein